MFRHGEQRGPLQVQVCALCRFALRHTLTLPLRVHHAADIEVWPKKGTVPDLLSLLQRIRIQLLESKGLF